MKSEVTTYSPTDNEKYGTSQVKIMNKGISPNPQLLLLMVEQVISLINMLLC